MSVLNYSKWDKIEISDDEDDTHPNIHTPSLFKWRHDVSLNNLKYQKFTKNINLKIGTRATHERNGI